MMAGQTINDRLLAARHSIAGQGLAKSVCKATTEEMIAPKKKHLDYLVHCTNEPNVSIPQLATLLVERAQSTNWVVVFKALVTTHHLLAYGNERFTQYLASSNSSFQLSNFHDKSGVQGYDMSPFIRRYARYLNEKALSYRTVAFDFCKVKRGNAEGSLRTLATDPLLKTLAALQAQLDALLEFDCGPNDLTNGVINCCFMLLFRDLIRLFACYNDGIINLLEKYFDMNKKQAREALDLYKKFLIRMDRVGEFLKVAESVGVDRGDIPDLTRAPSSLLDALEQHLQQLDPRHQPATPSASAAKSVASGVGALTSTSSAFGAAAGAASAGGAANGGGVLIDDALARQALAEEEQAMNQYKTKVSPPGGGGHNPFLSLSTPPSSAPMVDLFSAPPPANNSAPAPPSEDLLSLANPFADMFGPSPATQPQPAAMGANNVWGTNGGMGGAGMGGANMGGAGAGGFVSDASFSSVFSAPPPQPQQQQQGVTSGGAGGAMGGSGGVLTGDLESSLAQLAQNLDINARTNKMPALGRGAWSPQPLPTTAQPHYRPMGAGMPLPPPLTLHPPPMTPTHLATAGSGWTPRPFPAPHFS